MKKIYRQQFIKQLIHQKEIETQDELIAYLHQAGIKATQATISRDIREMNIVKIPNGEKHMKYMILSPEASQDQEEKFKESIRDFVNSIEQIKFMVVIHTELGNAHVVTNLLDQAAYQEVAGTVAGEDTIIVLLHNEKEANYFTQKIKRLMN
ncbi:arginine repressor [Melissococcus plutonius]|uniref:arginine repressor n=1 Tax=Melissococcus plutonius TaxID=33970 RepID=UPI003C2BF94B